MADECLLLERIEMEVEAGDAAVAEDAVRAAATAGDVAEDMEEAGAEEPRLWPME